MDSKINILLIGNDKDETRALTELLENNNYKVFSALTGREGLSLAASLCPEVILLKSELSDMESCNVLQQLRSWSNVPILICSANNEECEKVTALDLGADDFITNPIGPRELLARIRASLRHMLIKTPDHIYHALDLEINFDKRLVYLENSKVHLTNVEYRLLALLAENSGKVLSYRFLMNTLWGPYADDNNKILRVNMSNIRKKIEKNPAQPEYLFTEIGVGYRMLDNGTAKSH